MMNLICGVVLVFLLLKCAVVVRAGWVEQEAMTSFGRSLDFGNGLTFQLEDLKRQNTSFLESHALRLDYGTYGVTVGKARRKEAVEVGLFIQDDNEGRGKKGGGVSVLIGYKLAMIVTTVLALMGALVLKALWIAKFALFTAGSLLISKLFHHEQPHHYHAPTYVELDSHPEYSNHVQETIPASGGSSGNAASASAAEYHPSASSSAHYYAYNSYVPSGPGAAAAGDNSMSYSTVEAAPLVGSNSSLTSTGGGGGGGSNQQVVARRRDSTATTRKKKVSLGGVSPAITVHRYTFES